MYTMADIKRKQEVVTVPLMEASELNESTPASSNYSDDGTDTVSRRARDVTNEIEEFMAGMRRYEKNICGRELSAEREERYRQVLPLWNTFLLLVQGIRGTSVCTSSNIKGDINKFIPWLEERQGTQWTEIDKKMIKEWLPNWNMFLQARAGETLVTHLNLWLTIVGFVFYIVDLASDIITSMFFASNGQWGRAMLTLTIVYAAVIIQTVVKWTDGYIHCTGPLDRLRYLGTLLVNWPDVKQYLALCRLEWKLHKSPARSAHLVPEWHQRRRNVTLLKFTEGVCEACPQAILQLCFLVPDLYGPLTWTDYLRIASAIISMCTAGAALVNREKLNRIFNNIGLAPSELVVLLVWAVPVTVSRLLSVTLLLSLYPYWVLAGVLSHLVLRVVFCCSTTGDSSALNNIIDMCLYTLQYLISPFAVADSVTYRRVYHATHLVVNTAATVAWALGTPLETAHPALYTAITCFNAVMFAVGLVGWQLHEMYWPDSYPKHNG